MIDRRAVDIIQPDISLCGGLGEGLFVVAEEGDHRERFAIVAHRQREQVAVG